MSHNEVKVLAVVTVTYNSASVLPDFIASLDGGFDSGIDWRLVVVDNDSKDDSIAIVESLAPSATVVRMERNAGYAAGINAGVRAAGPGIDAYLLLNPDVRLGEGSVSTLLESLDRFGAGVVAPRLLDARGELIFSQRREPTLLRAWGDALLGAERAGRWSHLGEVVSRPSAYDLRSDCAWLEGSTLLVDRECWDAVGAWDEQFFLYSEETDFQLRVRDAGFSVLFEPSATAVHLEGGSAQSPALWALVQVNRVRLYKKRHRQPETFGFWLATLARETIRSLLGSQPSRTAMRALLSRQILSKQPGPETIAQLRGQSDPERRIPPSHAGIKTKGETSR
ncbi:MAG: glycosyltransferase family 2 protein [Microlunatus sp.]